MESSRRVVSRSEFGARGKRPVAYATRPGPLTWRAGRRMFTWFEKERIIFGQMEVMMTSR
jgi:hypothetical protein